MVAPCFRVNRSAEYVRAPGLNTRLRCDATSRESRTWQPGNTESHCFMRNQTVLPLAAVLLVSFSIFASGETPSGSKAASETGLEGVILVGPIRGGPTKQGVPNSGPLPGVEFVVKKENNAIAASFKTDDQGRFRVALPPGHYTVSRKDWQAAVGNYGPFEVDIAAGQVRKVQWNCDTGIR